MSENNGSLLPDLITPTSEALHRNLPETEKQADGAISTVVGFFNNVVLYPVKKANLTFRYKLESFEDDLKNKTKHIPAEHLQIPPARITGPVLESLRYAYDEDELREMYEEMLASAMDVRKASKVHCSYVDAIRQMEPLDAMVLRRIYELSEISSVQIKFYKAGTSQYYTNAMPYHYSDQLLDLGDAFQISASISNLLRLGLLISINGILNKGASERIKSEPYVQQRYLAYNKLEGGVTIDVSIDCNILRIDSYGRHFIDVCMLTKEEKDAD